MAVNSTTSEGLRDECALCFDVLHAKLNGDSAPPSDKIGQGLKFPLFVTWNIQSSSRPGQKQKRLRGCIGNFEPMELNAGLADYAEISAFKDHRFRPISSSEFPKLSVGVSLLADFEPCADPMDWDLDTHGIYVQFPNPAIFPRPPPAPSLSSSASFPSLSALPKYALPSPTPSNPRREPLLLNATYLPGVATEQGWTKREALESCIQKAGWDGQVSEEMLASVRVTRYQSRKGELTHDQWRQLRGN